MEYWNNGEMARRGARGQGAGLIKVLHLGRAN